MSRRKNELPPAPVAVVGAGLSGKATMRLLRLQGYGEHELTLFDAVPGRGSYSSSDALIDQFAPETLVVSPGVPLATPWIRAFGEQGGVITSELELAALFLEHERVVGVTGSLGKSTTVSLLGRGAKAFDPASFTGGNLGFPLADYIADVIEKKRSRAQWVILELSSFQLENASTLSFVASAFTYLSKNHLERYTSLEEYYDVKWRLARQTHGPVVLNLNGGDLAQFVKERMRSGDGPHSDYLHWVNRESSFLAPSELERSKLVGSHNRDNLAVAAEIARLCGWPASSLEAMLSFAGLPHRVEAVGEYGGVRFINDSKATTMESVLTAAQSVLEESKGSLWLLLGGRDKKLPWEKLSGLSESSQLKFAFFGECGAHARTQSTLKGEVYPTLKDAMRTLPKVVQPGDSILLSPGGTSLDEFKNFEDRGLSFAQMARENFAR